MIWVRPKWSVDDNKNDPTSITTHTETDITLLIVMNYITVTSLPSYFCSDHTTELVETSLCNHALIRATLHHLA